MRGVVDEGCGGVELRENEGIRAVEMSPPTAFAPSATILAEGMTERCRLELLGPGVR